MDRLPKAAQGLSKARKPHLGAFSTLGSLEVQRMLSLPQDQQSMEQQREITAVLCACNPKTTFSIVSVLTGMALPPL